MLLALSLACQSPDDAGAPVDTAAEDSGAQDTDDTDDTHDTDDTDLPGDLHGTPPEEAVPAPEFAARDEHGAARSRDDLLGHPTVLWFYPAAGTYG